MSMKTIKLALIVSPIIIFLVGRAFVMSNGSKNSSGSEQRIDDAVQRVPVFIQPLTRVDFERRVKVQGNVEAKNYADVAARISGTLEKVFVEEGDPVVTCTTQLFQVDMLKIQKSLEIQKQEIEVAKYTLAEKQASLEHVQAELDKAEMDFKRYEKLASEKTISLDEYEQQQKQYREAVAREKLARSLVALQEEQLKREELAFMMAEKDLSDTLVCAPITGVISKKYLEPGEMASAGMPVVRIIDPTLLEVSAFLPAETYNSIIPGLTKMRLNANGTKVGMQTISYKSPTIDPSLRTYEIKCLISNPPSGVVPGALADIEVILEARSATGIHKNAIEIRNGKSVIFTVENDLARMLEVSTGIETDGMIEVEGDHLIEGMPVVTMGQFLLNDKTPVIIRKGNN